MKKAVILASGLGTRLAEETSIRPKPMVEIGGRPILWHIMKIYSRFGVNEFIVCLGYKGYVVKEYFQNYSLHLSDVTLDLKSGRTTVHQNRVDPWTISLIDTGDATMTGGRIKRIRQYVGDEPFHMTYGDGVSDIDLARLMKFHTDHGRDATVTVVHPPSRFGAVDMEGDQVNGFREKPVSQGGFINAGFFILSPKVFDLIDDDSIVWEREPMERLAQQGQLMAYRHEGFWQPMDTLRDKQLLESMWVEGKAPWVNRNKPDVV